MRNRARAHSFAHLIGLKSRFLGSPPPPTSPSLLARVNVARKRVRNGKEFSREWPERVCGDPLKVIQSTCERERECARTSKRRKSNRVSAVLLELELRGRIARVALLISPGTEANLYRVTSPLTRSAVSLSLSLDNLNARIVFPYSEARTPSGDAFPRGRTRFRILARGAHWNYRCRLQITNDPHARAHPCHAQDAQDMRRRRRRRRRQEHARSYSRASCSLHREFTISHSI